MDNIQEQMGSLTSCINANQEEMRARVSAIQYNMEVMIKCSQEEMMATVNSMCDEVQETMKHRPGICGPKDTGLLQGTYGED
jgi:hypothetical protein